MGVYLNKKSITNKYLLILYLLCNSFLFSQSFTLVGDASSLGNDCYQVTPDATWKTGAIWHNNQIDLNNSFDIHCQLNFGSKDGNGADGMVFVLQTAGPNALGDSGGGIGFAGFSPSLGVEFDTYYNSGYGDLRDDHIGILKNGSVNHNSANGLAGPVVALPPNENIEDGAYHDVRFEWNAETKTLSIYFDCIFRLSLTEDIVNTIFNGRSLVYWGFTSSTGTMSNDHRVCMEQHPVYSTDSTAICDGSATILQPFILDGVNYVWTPAAGLDNPNIATPAASPSSNTTYIATFQDNCGVEYTDTQYVEVSDFELTISEDTIICLGQNVELSMDTIGIVRCAWDAHPSISDTSVSRPIVTPTETTTYTVIASYEIGQNLVVNGDFSQGNNWFYNDYVYSSPSPLGGPGHYTVSPSISNSWWGSSCVDHTTGTGNALVVDGANGSVGVPRGANVWCQTVPVEPNTNYAFSSWLMNASVRGSTSVLAFNINGAQIGDPQITPPEACGWNKFYVIWNSGNNTSANICLRETGGAQPGNDFAIDDISFYKICEQTKSVTVEVFPVATATIDGISEVCDNENGSTITFMGDNGVAPYIFTYSVNGEAPEQITSTGNTATLNIPTHPVGSYSYSLLSVEDGNGPLCTVDLDEAIEINVNPLPEPSFTYGDEICVNSPIEFINTSTISTFNNAEITDWYWDFGDGTSSTEENPFHSYSSGGDYEISLTAISDSGCEATTSSTLSISLMPSIQISASSVCLGEEVEFNMTVNPASDMAQIQSWNWNFGTGETSVEQTPVYNYDATGSYDVYLAVLTQQGCQDTIRRSVEVYPIPEASFTGLNLEGCAPVCPTITSTSTIDPPSGIDNFEWTISNGSTGTGNIFEDCFESAASQDQHLDVTLKVTSNNGCTSTTTEENFIQIHSTPEASFYFEPQKPSVIDNEVVFFNTTSYATVFQWIFGNFENSSAKSPIITFPDTADSYEIILIAETVQGCIDTARVILNITEETIFYVPNSFTPNMDGSNDIFKPTFTSGLDPSSYKLSIYSRWGILVFESNDVTMGWDGTFGANNYNIVEDGTYVWKMEFTELNSGESYSYYGSVNVLK